MLDSRLGALVQYFWIHFTSPCCFPSFVTYPYHQPCDQCFLSVGASDPTVSAFGREKLQLSFLGANFGLENTERTDIGCCFWILTTRIHNDSCSLTASKQQAVNDHQPLASICIHCLRITQLQLIEVSGWVADSFLLVVWPLWNMNHSANINRHQPSARQSLAARSTQYATVFWSRHHELTNMNRKNCQYQSSSTNFWSSNQPFFNRQELAKHH